MATYDQDQLALMAEDWAKPIVGDQLWQLANCSQVQGGSRIAPHTHTPTQRRVTSSPQETVNRESSGVAENATKIAPHTHATPALYMREI